MLRGGKNYKKKVQDPKVDVTILEKQLKAIEETPPRLVKQPYETRQPYQPSPFGEERATDGPRITRNDFFSTKSG